VAIGDLNGDGKLDLAVADFGDNAVSVLLGNGNGTFGAKTDFATGDAPECVAIGDMNGDGKPDLATANIYGNTVSVLLGNGNGAFGTRADYPTGSGPVFVAIGDLNGDGRLDLAVADSYAATVSVLLGNGAGGFGAKTDFATGGYPWSVAIGDLNGDGKPDLAVSSGAGAGPNLAVGSAGVDIVDYTVSVLLGNGDGTFGAKTDFATGSGPHSVAIGDLSGDGKPDLAVANLGSNTVSVLLGDGNGAFSAKTDFGTGGGPYCVAIRDLNGDGKPDLVTANLWSTVSVLLNMSPDVPTPTLVELLRAVPTADGIRVEWQLGDPSAFQSLALESSASEAGEWSRVQQVPQVQGGRSVVLDTAAPAGQEQWYRLSGVQRDGSPFTFGPVSATAQGAVTAFALSPLSPNPSRGHSLLTFAVPTRTRVRLSLVDVQGREVAVLADGLRGPGRYTAALEASDLSAGMYFVRMQADGVNLTRRLAVVR
jgi:hypothetical protein